MDSGKQVGRDYTASRTQKPHARTIKRDSNREKNEKRSEVFNLG